MSVALAELDRLEQRLAEIQTPRDAKAEIVWTQVIAEMARALGLSREQQNEIAEHRLRSMRRGGELLPQSGIGKGVKSVTLADLGVEQDDSKRWQAVAAVPGEVFEEYIAAERIDGEITVAGLLKLRLAKPVPEPESEPLEEALSLLRFCQPDLPTPTIIALILRVAFPDAETAIDLTYGSGNFWDGSAHVDVLAAHDANPARAPHGREDFTSLPYADEAFDVALFDPPHIADAGAESIMGQRFGTASEDDIELAIRVGTCEAWRLARLGIVVKVANHVHGQRFVCETDWVREALGRQVPYEEVHQTRTGALVDPRWEDQLSAHNNGATYLIFRKGDQRHVRRGRNA